MLAAEHLKVLFSSASMEIAVWRNPAGNLLDMAVLTNLAEHAVRDYWIPKVFGSGAAPLLKAHRTLRADLDAILAKSLFADQLALILIAARLFRRRSNRRIKERSSTG